MSFSSGKEKHSCAYWSLVMHHGPHDCTLFSMHSVNRLDDKLYSYSWFRTETVWSFDCRAWTFRDLRWSHLRPDILRKNSVWLWNHTFEIDTKLKNTIVNVNLINGLTVEIEWENVLVKLKRLKQTVWA